MEGQKCMFSHIIISNYLRIYIINTHTVDIFNIILIFPAFRVQNQQLIWTIEMHTKTSILMQFFWCCWWHNFQIAIQKLIDFNELIKCWHYQLWHWTVKPEFTSKIIKFSVWLTWTLASLKSNRMANSSRVKTLIKK